MTSGFKKPTALIRDAKVALHKAVGANVPADTRRGFTDRFEILSPLVTIAYKNEPKQRTKDAIVEGAKLAREIMRKANDEFAAVVLLRRPESQLFQDVLRTHFHLIAGDLAGNTLKDNIVNKKFSVRGIVEKDRRWVLEKIREKMLSISFHLNTGVYLIDGDNKRRDMETGQTTHVGSVDATTEAYVSPHKTSFDSATWQPDGAKFVGGLLAGFKNGEIHVGFSAIKNYSAISFARVIIHEATHKYLNTNDEAYAWDPDYTTLSLARALNNADSYAWAALSLYCGGIKMASRASYTPDWEQCTK